MKRSGGKVKGEHTIYDLNGSLFESERGLVSVGSSGKQTPRS